MVVSADSQKIVRNKRRYKSRKVSISHSGQISLFRIPFIFSLFIFSIYINISDFYWYIRTPEFSVRQIALPEENKLLKASINLKIVNPDFYVTRETEEDFYLSSYTVREDDRYSIIADKFKISIDSILSVNGISNRVTPDVGSELLIPNISGLYYVVEKGDTLTYIASKFDLEVEELNSVNDLYSSVIHIGDRLFIPDAEMDKDELNRIIGEKFLIPAAGSIKNNYGSYLDPVTGLKNYNYGIDIINSKGTAVYAAKDGIINNTSYNPYYGRVVLVNHSGSFQSMYSCLDSIVVSLGQSVKRGELLGYIGNSGFRSVDHLQFSIFKNKEDVDTLEFIF